MLTLMRLRNAKEEVIEGLAKKRMDARRLVEEVLAMDLHRRELQSESDAQQALINQKSREVGQRMKQGEHELAEALKGEVAVIKERLKLKQTELEALRKKINGVLVQLPNVPHSSVPEGATSKENTVVRRGGEVLALQKGALPHWDNRF